MLVHPVSGIKGYRCETILTEWTGIPIRPVTLDVGIKTMISEIDRNIRESWSTERLIRRKVQPTAT